MEGSCWFGPDLDFRISNGPRVGSWTVGVQSLLVHWVGL